MEWFGTESLAKVWQEVKSTRGRDGSKPSPVGIDGVTAEGFDSNLAANLAEISRMLSQPDLPRPTRYRFAPLRRKVISREPGSHREIFVPRIRDQIVLRAIGKLLKDKISGNALNFPDTSPRQAVKRVIAAREEGCRLVLRTDIAQYYQSIPHDQMLDRVRTLQVDKIAFQLIGDIMTTPLRDPKKGKACDMHPERGVPTGVSISTTLGEFFLMDLSVDFHSSGRLQLVRYMDDLLLASDNKAYLKSSASRLKTKIENKGLSFSKTKTNWTSFEEGFEFLGFMFKGDKLLISEKKSAKWVRSYVGITRKHIDRVEAYDTTDGMNPSLQQMIHEINREISGASGMQVPYYSMADDLSPFKRLDRQIREVIGGIFRRKNLTMKGEFRVESAYSWAWKYKRDYNKAMSLAKNKFEPLHDLD